MDLPMAIIGFGEAASTFARAAGWGAGAVAFDIDPARRAVMARAGIGAAESARAAVEGSHVILSLVTAGNALAAVHQGAPHIASGALWLDMNSVAPETKRAAAAEIQAAGGRYVDVAVLAPVDPARMAVPLLVSGPHAGFACETLGRIGFTNVRTVGAEVGRASAIKMIRSVMVKGIEALTDEMMAGAEAAGVAEEVLASLDASDSPQRWSVRAAYNRERMATHGLRRAEEMKEAARTLRALGVDPVMTDGTVQRQQAAANPRIASRDAA
ncbi:MAG: 6-phosphogluconate dehydrogenase [Sphingomonas sp.]|nr:6-phosphogluconate dehydrogenase [Sphingomonas sp.]